MGDAVVAGWSFSSTKAKITVREANTCRYELCRGNEVLAVSRQPDPLLRYAVHNKLITAGEAVGMANVFGVPPEDVIIKGKEG
jgi:hypothetical protein